MTAEPSEQDDSEPQRPELHVVRDDEPDADQDAETPEVGEAPEETEVETTGPVPVLDADGNPVTAQPPLDVRARCALTRGVRAVPAFGQVPASFAESWEYSQEGDWTSSESGAKRIAHGLCTVIAYTASYPFVEGIGAARTKPVRFVLTLIVLIALTYTAAAVL